MPARLSQLCVCVCVCVDGWLVGLVKVVVVVSSSG